ncbi:MULTISPECIES: hypothetical protein [Methylosinus]|uniref:Uncharacterized protein n=1 Tax=Methylosinus trichosporium (strain ATCC 35070 / NCIMB 11131 / UNIQEM 75 / OB3b) TaxID=595536 RepID=A0A2D2D443_METT3|nr:MULTISPECIES: hypothetical protein [Methylosinus]ATQ69726.1 hypothetical protein CQW49_18930 [Methylosinus trichosporium OB3b]OBS52474.1 hypothetical protein A8B73_11530 [Methylosinus sp. 3S-1]
MSKVHVLAAALLAASLAGTRAEAFCLFSCEPTAENARKVFENRVKQKFAADAVIDKFEVTRFWRLDVEGAGHAAVEYYFDAAVSFPSGANPECKPDEAGAVKPGCSASKYFSTTVSNQEVKDKQYIEPGAKIEFKDETRFDEAGKGWKGQDGNSY